MDGHDAFAKAAPRRQSQPNGAGKAIVGGGLLAHGAASAPVLKTGRKKPTQMVGASPKVQPERYQGELTEAMKAGKVEANSTLRVLKTPSGRYLNAGGTHRHLAREAMGMPTEKISVAHLAFEPRQNLYGRIQNRRGIAELKRGSKAAVAGKAKPVGEHARKANVGMAAAADTNDDVAWHGFKETGGAEMRSLARAQHKIGLGSAAITAGLGGALLASGIHQHNKQKVVKAMDGHAGFEISKREHPRKNRDISVGRTVTGALFPGFHGAIAGKKGHKLKAVGHEVGGGLVGGLVGLPMAGAGFGTIMAADKKHYKKLSKAAGATDVAAVGKGKKASVAYPPEVKAYIAAKQSELSKSVTGHEAFLEDVEKAFSLGGAMDAVKGVGAIGRGVMKPIMARGAGAHVGPGKVAQGAGKIGGFAAKKPLATAGIAGGAGLGAGFMAGRKN